MDCQSIEATHRAIRIAVLNDHHVCIIAESWANSLRAFPAAVNEYRRVYHDSNAASCFRQIVWLRSKIERATASGARLTAPPHTTMASLASLIRRSLSRFRMGGGLVESVMSNAVGQGRGAPARPRRQHYVQTREFLKRILNRATAFELVVLSISRCVHRIRGTHRSRPPP
jgi:hypothetical protein